MKRLAILCVSILMTVGCRQPDSGSTSFQNETGGKSPASVPQKASDGTVDGGGGNSVADAKTGDRVLLDLAENSDNEPFDFDVRALLEANGGAGIKWDAYQDIVHTPTFKSWAGEEDFFNWALYLTTRSNEEMLSEDKSLYDIHVSAFELTEGQKIKNLQYAFTDKELDAVGDQGLMRVSNPETKRQVAVQDNKGFVLLNRREFNNLNIDSKLALKIHESVLYLVMKFNPNLILKKGTAPIREFVKNVFNYSYTSKVKSQKVVSAAEVKKSFAALGLPSFKPSYSKIGLVSDASTDTTKICKLQRSGDSRNYFFALQGRRVSGSYAMDADFFMKIQLYLVGKGVCIFKPEPCEMKSIRLVGSDEGQFNFVVGDEILPDSSDDGQYMQDVILKKYQQARLCQ